MHSDGGGTTLNCSTHQTPANLLTKALAALHTGTILLTCRAARHGTSVVGKQASVCLLSLFGSLQTTVSLCCLLLRRKQGQHVHPIKTNHGVFPMDAPSISWCRSAATRTTRWYVASHRTPAFGMYVYVRAELMVILVTAATYLCRAWGRVCTCVCACGAVDARSVAMCCVAAAPLLV